MALVSFPDWLQKQDYSAAKLRRVHEKRGMLGEGVGDYNDFRVSERGVGANMSVDIAAGDAWIRGDDVTNQGLYHLVNDATANLAIAPAHATLPRIDQIVARIYDSTITGSTDVPALEARAGTATSGATLDNRTGAAALPNGALLLADVLVDAAVGSILNAKIRSRRSYSGLLIPPVLTNLDMVPLIPIARPTAPGCTVTHSTQDGYQSAVLCWLPRRIVNATRIRWRYFQGAQLGTPITNVYTFAIFDASGRKIVDCGVPAWTGANGVVVGRAEVIAATTFEVGMYYVFFGNDSGAGAASYEGVANATGANVGGPAAANLAFVSTTGGTTVPMTLLSMSDLQTLTGAYLDVPQVMLAVS